MRIAFLTAFITILMIFPAVSACISITEIHPNPEDAKNEWLEIHNNCNMSINLSDVKINDSSSFSKQLNGLTTDTFIIVANKQDLFEGVFGTLNSTVINLSYGSPWMNNVGDTVYMFNGTALLDIMTYTSSVVGNSWSLCNGTWTETENATPGYPNDCPKPTEFVNETNITNNNMADNITYESSLSDMELTVADNSYMARFGDVEYIECYLFTNGTPATLRIVAYINHNNDNGKQKWLTKDKKGNTITCHFNESDTAMILETSSTMQMIALQIPIMLKNNCNDEYADGEYSGFVRVYQDVTGKEIPYGKFNITVQGNNPLFCCEECPECKIKTSNCADSSVTMNDVLELFELTGFPEDAYAGEPFNVKVRLENTGIYESEYIVYSYAYQGSRCLTYGLGEDGWKKTWTANQRIMEVPEHSSKEIILESMFPDDTLPGIYTYRIRLKYSGKEYDITRALKLKEPPPSVVLNTTKDISQESAEEPESVPSAAITGMAAGTEDNLNPVKTIYDSFIEWLASLFKF
ncbi:MAG: lamin tail domain-containing protein [Candidatus Aenigmarchaeota archaeon]|nr:lamin tail domain-containing protein [Candidatus Aenigmarchaeota archaeon]